MGEHALRLCVCTVAALRRDWRVARAKIAAQKKAQKATLQETQRRNANERGVIVLSPQIAQRMRMQADAGPAKSGIERTF